MPLRSRPQVQPPLEFIPPNFNPWVLRGVHGLLPGYLQWRAKIRHIETENVETLVDLYQQFQAGKIRFLMAFRHPSTDDPLSLVYLLSQSVPQVARRQGIPLRSPIHTHFMYDRGIPLWAGSLSAWLYSRLGGTPIQRGKIDRVGLRSARDLFANGQFPMLAAPEGATNGHSEVISPLEPGLAQLGFWCVEDLQKAGRDEQVFIVPIGLQYHYLDSPWEALESLLQTLEHDSGLSLGQPIPTPVSGQPDFTLNPPLYQRLLRLGEHLLTEMEEYYRRFYHQTLPPSTPESPLSVAERLQSLLNAALTVAEDYFGLLPKGTVIDRCRRLEQAGWDCIYRDDIPDLDALSPLERGLADRIAEEAQLRMWHMRLVESFVAVTGRYVVEKPSVERFAETSLLLWDLITRIKGGNPFARPRLGPQGVRMTVGQPISVSARWEGYQANRRSAKQAIADLTQDLQTALEQMIQ